MDLDLNGMNEENGGPTFSAINARSYHPGGVNVLFGRWLGPVRQEHHRRNGLALGTVAGGEILSGNLF